MIFSHYYFVIICLFLFAAVPSLCMYYWLFYKDFQCKISLVFPQQNHGKLYWQGGEEIGLYFCEKILGNIFYACLHFLKEHVWQQPFWLGGGYYPLGRYLGAHRAQVLSLKLGSASLFYWWIFAHISIFVVFMILSKYYLRYKVSVFYSKRNNQKQSTFTINVNSMPKY